MIRKPSTKSLLTSTSRRSFLRVTAGAGFAFAAGVRPRLARAATEKILFQLDWIPFGRHTPYYAALENGFYLEKGLDVTIAQGRSTIQGIRTLVAGQSQFIFQDIAVMMSVRATEGSKIKALACMYQKSPHTLFYIKGPSITKPKDIEGKKIAFTPGDSPRRMFPAFAKANGIDESKVSWLSVDPNSKNAVLLNHQAGGMLTYIFTLPVLQKAAQNGDQVGAFVYSDYGADFYSNGIGAMEDYIKEKPVVTRDFVQATMKGLKFTLDHPKEAVGMLMKHQPQLDRDVALQEVEILRNITNANNAKVLGSMTKEKMQETEDLMVKYMDLKSPVDVSKVYTNEYLS
jgi:NitT/TauT family transport system substrate-binding protein